MKKIAFCTLLFALFAFSSCGLFDNDNYDEPQETLRGEVVDIATGEPILTEQAGEGIRVRLTELSWGDNVQHNPDFFCMPDGTFQNTKLFKGRYNIRIDGPFIPLLRENSYGVPLVDETIETKISGVTTVRFEVEPFLKVELLGEPTISNGQVTAKVKVIRGVDKEIFKDKIEDMEGERYKDEFLNMTDIQLFVSYSSSVGYRSKDDRWSNSIEYTGTSFESLFGEEITIKSKNTIPIPSGRTVFVRAAARINYETPKGSGTRRWNYSQSVELMAP